MKLLEREAIDYAMLPIGGNFTMDLEDSLHALELIRPKKAIPMHYNTFNLIKEDPNKFKSPLCEVVIMNPNETLDI